MIEQQLYIGCVERIVEIERHSIGQLRPLYFYGERNSTPDWYHLEPDEVHKQFPNRGLVTLFDSPWNIAKGTMWQFRLESQRYNPEDSNHDAFRAISPWLLEEVLDIRSADGEDHARLLLTQEGVWLSFIPHGRVYLWAEDRLWIGPVHLSYVPETDHWILKSEERNNPLTCFLPAPEQCFIRLENGRLLVLPGKAGRRLGMVDWAGDEVILSRVLHWLQRIDPAFMRDLELTSKAIARTVEHLDVIDSAGRDTMLEAQRLQRAHHVIEQVTEHRGLVEELAQSLLHFGPVAQEVERAIIQARQTTIAEIRAEAATHIDDLSSQTKAVEEELSGLQCQITEKRSELALLEKSIDERQKKVTAQVDALDTALTERLAELINRPEQLLADVAIFRAALSLSSFSQERSIDKTTTHEGSGHQIYRQASSWFQPKVEVTLLREPDAVRKALRNAFRERGVPLRAAAVLHNAFLSGAMPVLAGSNAFEALSAYASCISSDRLLWLPISPTMLEPSDLLGKVDPTTRHFVPQPGGLIDLLLYAHTTSDLYLVVLDGINRAAVDAYLSPILSCYKDAWNSNYVRMLPLLNQCAIDSEDPYVSAAHLIWPPNVLIAGILTEGVTTVPPPPAFWSSAVLLHLDQYDENVMRIAPVSSNTVGRLTATTVSQETWQQWHRQLLATDTTACIEVLNSVLEGGLTLRSQVRLLCTQFYAAAQLWGAAEEGAIEDVITHCLVPKAVSSHQADLLLEILGSMQYNTALVRTAIKLTEQVLE